MRAIFTIFQTLFLFLTSNKAIENKWLHQQVKYTLQSDNMSASVNPPKIRHFIFGYGSLVCSKSRKITAPTLTKPAHPVVINHLRRTWTARVPHRGDKIREDLDQLKGQTAMGIEIAQNHNCTGVLIEVDDDQLAQFDEREKGYNRVEIDLHHIFDTDHLKRNEEDHDSVEHSHDVLKVAHAKRKSMTGSIQNDANIDQERDEYDNYKVWVYVPKNGGTGADHEYPIMQSYVDIIMRGCLSIGKDFAMQFLQSTHGWWHDKTVHHPESEVPEYLWIDDRHEPFYVRADEEWSSDMKHMLDDMLKEIHPEPFEKRRHLTTLSSKNNSTEDSKTESSH